MGYVLVWNLILSVNLPITCITQQTFSLDKWLRNQNLCFILHQLHSEMRLYYIQSKSSLTLNEIFTFLFHSLQMKFHLLQTSILTHTIFRFNKKKMHLQDSRNLVSLYVVLFNISLLQWEHERRWCGTTLGKIYISAHMIRAYLLHVMFKLYSSACLFDNIFFNLTSCAETTSSGTAPTNFQNSVKH